jgi:hypothetical protein
MVVVPTLTPITVPVLPTVATDIEAELHTPPGVPSVRVMVDPVATVEAPDIVPAVGTSFTVIICVATAVPQLVVTA